MFPKQPQRIHSKAHRCWWISDPVSAVAPPQFGFRMGKTAVAVDAGMWSTIPFSWTCPSKASGVALRVCVENLVSAAPCRFLLESSSCCNSVINRKSFESCSRAESSRNQKIDFGSLDSWNWNFWPRKSGKRKNLKKTPETSVYSCPLHPFGSDLRTLIMAVQR